VHRTERSNFYIDSHQFTELTLALFKLLGYYCSVVWCIQLEYLNKVWWLFLHK